MNKLVIPSSPNWYEADIMACAPDNTILYGSRQDIVVIKPTPEDQPNDVQIVAKAHSLKIVSININRNWGAPHKYAVTVSEDKIIKLWDVETLEKKLSHSKHVSLDTNAKVIGACFCGDDRVLSASENGMVVVWNLLNNETHVLNSLFANSKVTLTCLSVCPHATWLAAFGLKSGLVVVVDLRRTGNVLYTLRGHSKAVVSLSWCPAPVNIFPSKPHNRVIEKPLETTGEEVENTAQIEEETGEETINVKIDRRKQSNPKKSTSSLTEYFLGGKREESNDLKENLELKKEVLNQDSGELEIVETESCEFQTIVSSETKNSSAQSEGKSKKQEFSVNDILSKKGQEGSDDASGESSSTPTQAVLPEDQKLDFSGSSKESRHFSSASSCDHDLNCAERSKEILDAEEPKNTGSSSEVGEVFHDAQEEGCLKDSTGDAGAENWRTEEPAGVDEEPRKEFLLASSAREPNIYIWRAGTDGRMQTFMAVPKSSKYQKKSSSPEKLWISLCWVAPNILLSSSRNAELLQWTLPKPLLQTKYLRTIHKDHWSVLFSIKAPVIYSNEYNFLQKRDINAWTAGMDRLVLNTDLSSTKNMACYPTFGGGVNCLAGSPLDPNRLAIGTGEGILNVWDLSRAHKKKIVFSTFYQKILSSVTALAWHPVSETTLAWATTEGRVGLIEVTGKARQPKILPHFFKSQIFKMEWGPLNGGDVEKQSLFVVSESKVAIFDPNSKEKEPQMLELPDNTSVYTMAWKPDYSMLLVSSKSGTLITYSADLKISNISYLSQKLQSILWHPDSASDDVSVSKYCKTFVSVNKYTEFVVFDLSVQSESTEDKIIARFENRGARIAGIAWSPHSGNHLVLVDDGGVAQVYDTELKTLISTYINPSLDPLLSVHWSPADPDCILVGTISHKLIVWKVSEHGSLMDKEITSIRNKITKAQQKEVSDQLTSDKDAKSPSKDDEAAKNKTLRKSQVVPLFYSVREKTQVQDLQKLLQWKLGNGNVESSIGDSSHLDVLDIFGDQGHMERVFELNMATFKQEGKHQKGNMLTLFQGDISTVIKEAIEQKRVNAWIISMCPMVSPRLWQTACETYVQQLMDEPEADPLEVVTYLLACHKVEASVRFLCERQLFREALVLAKARFGANSTTVSEILDQWAKNNVFQGNFELAALCYITLEKFEEAASVLFRRSSAEILEVAAQLAQLSENEELHKAVVFRLNAFKLDQEKSKESQDVSTTVQTNGNVESGHPEDVQVNGNKKPNISEGLYSCLDAIESVLSTKNFEKGNEVLSLQATCENYKNILHEKQDVGNPQQESIVVRRETNGQSKPEEGTGTKIDGKVEEMMKKTDGDESNKNTQEAKMNVTEAIDSQN